MTSFCSLSEKSIVEKLYTEQSNAFPFFVFCVLSMISFVSELRIMFILALNDLSFMR